MANNIDITAGSGTTVATDDISGSHYQRIKLTDGTEDSSTPVSTGNGVAANGIRVTVASDCDGQIALAPHTTNGLTTYHRVATTSTNAVNVKASAGQVYVINVSNHAIAMRKLAFHDTSGTPTAGSSVFFSIVVEAMQSIQLTIPHGIVFSSGIGITTVTGVADSNSTGVTADDMVINIWYA